MFNFEKALLPWNGEHVTFFELQRRLSDVRLQYLSEIPPEIGVRELLLIALEHQWIVEETSGRLRIEVSEGDTAHSIGLTFSHRRRH